MQYHFTETTKGNSIVTRILKSQKRIWHQQHWHASEKAGSKLKWHTLARSTWPCTIWAKINFVRSRLTGPFVRQWKVIAVRFHASLVQGSRWILCCNKPVHLLMELDNYSPFNFKSFKKLISSKAWLSLIIEVDFWNIIVFVNSFELAMQRDTTELWLIWV